MTEFEKTRPFSSAGSRSLPLKMRADLEFKRQCYQGREYWLVKDPVSLKFYRFEPEEYALLQMLNGKVSAEEIRQRFDDRFAPQKIRMRDLWQFIGMLHRRCLLISDQDGQGNELYLRHQQQRQRRFSHSFSNVLAIRCRGVDPDRVLGRLMRYTGWVFTWPAALASLCIGLLAVGIVTSQWETLSLRMPGFHQFFASDNWIWLALVVMGTKVLHELGHGIACKKLGGQCHEMGVMFLVLMPCLYCNVSDTWMLNNKWSRALIAAAGMYVELVLAALATLVWCFSEPGLINQLALNIMIVCSISTLIFNGNPLLRYDGYYILSDLLEIPNLRQKSSTLLQRWLGEFFLGMPHRADPFLPVKKRWLFVAYSIAAVVYRWLIMFAIFWFLYEFLKPYGAQMIGQCLILLAVWSLLGVPLMKLHQFFSVPGRWDTVKPKRALFSIILATASLAGLLFVPLPHYVHCSFYVQPRDVTNVFVDVPGVLQSVVADPNTVVAPGNALLYLQDDDLEQQLEQFHSRVRGTQVAYESMKFMSQRDASLLEELDAAHSEWSAAAQDLKQREIDLPRLTVRAQAAGILLEPPRREPATDDSRDLNNWSGSPLDRSNLGAYLEQKTLVGRIVPDPSKMEAILAIDQADVEFVRADQTVSLRVNQLPGERFSSLTPGPTPTRMEQLPRSLSSRYGGPMIGRLDSNGREIPESTCYLLSVPLDIHSETVLDGATGQARIRTGTQSMGQRLWRVVCQTFRFEL